MDLANAMATLLANAYLMYAHAHIAHWNITGPDFHDKHGFLNTIYDDVYDSVDGIAEHLRTTGAYVEPTFHNVLGLASMSDENVPRDWAGIRALLLRDNDGVISALSVAFVAAAGNQGMQNYLADRLDKHATWAWMLKASI